MVSAAWGLPLSLAFVAAAWLLWPKEERRFACLSLLAALDSAWAGQAALAAGLGMFALLLGLRLKAAWGWNFSLAGPAIILALLRLRVEYFPVLPEKMAFWAGLLALVAAAIAAQGLLAKPEEEAPKYLAAGQMAWACFGLVTGSAQAPLAWTGMLALLWQQPLLRIPLAKAMGGEAPPKVALALLFLGLGGCLGLSAFSAYFQLFVPLMGQGDGVATMQAKLFSGAGLLAAVAMLAVLVQTAAFGYFYWLNLLPKEQGRKASAGLWLALGLSFVWALQADRVSGLALSALRSIGSKIPYS